MTPSPPSPVQQLDVRILPATAACDYEFWEARLISPHLLRDAVAVALHRLPLLAVPVGADRRSGHMDMLDPGFAQLLAHVLRGRPGFERPVASGRLVRWGDPMPDNLAPDAHRRFQGLREQPRRPASIRPPAGHGGHDLGLPPPKSPPGRQPTPPRAVVQAGAAPTP
ncbi:MULTISPECIES: DUF6302 family protein [unclassified Streptomyces]|uniref:DUF6302 family protein n=1 Tax=unclassified Streptomyces TaxID=2593676 RepID=UPI0036E6065C